MLIAYIFFAKSNTNYNDRYVFLIAFIIGVRLKFILYQYIVANQADININL